MRLALLTLSAAVATALVSPPAQAAGILTCTLWYGNGSANGITQGNGTCNNGVLLSFTASNNCPQQSATGTATGGGLAFSFTWQRNGTSGVMTTSGNPTGVGVLTFSSPCQMSGETMVVGYGP